ncbi:MAG: ATP-binding protein, partial [Clostridia bacterium]|nr:ATP-binding protein [Clostridia bacterium]
MEENSIFVVGPIAAGESFIGRKKEIKDLEVIFGDSTAGIHLYGSTRIGKSSLAEAVIRLHKNDPDRIIVKLDMSQYPDAFSFWHGLARQLEKTLAAEGISDDLFDERFAEIKSFGPDSPMTYFNEALFDVLYALGETCGQRLVLIIDEFDAVKRVFGDDITNYQVLRTLYYEPECYTSGLLLSRMALQDIEKRNINISSFSGVFDEVPLKAFSDADMKEFYEKLARCGVGVTESGRKMLEYCTGRLPMLCCMLAKNMVLNRASRSEYDGEAV